MVEFYYAHILIIGSSSNVRTSSSPASSRVAPSTLTPGMTTAPWPMRRLEIDQAMRQAS